MSRSLVVLAALTLVGCSDDPRTFTASCNGVQREIRAHSFRPVEPNGCVTFTDDWNQPLAKFCGCSEISSK